MRRLVWLSALVALLAGLGGAGAGAGAAGGRGVSVTIRLSSWKVVPGARTTTRVDTFTLSCNPPRGTLPFAARLCRDIRAHPTATLTPPTARTVCSGVPVHPNPNVAATVPYALRVKTVVGGTATVFGDDRPQECDWPVGWATGLYWAAVERDSRRLAATEAKLGCLEDPALLATPTPWTLVYRCMGWPPSQASTNRTTLLLGRFPWLAPSMRRTVADMFGGVSPIATKLIDYDSRYDQRIVVLFEFAGVVDCVTCSDDPTALADPTVARVFRVSYDRETRRGLVTRLCETLTACR
jgi:hypothetical protein